MTTLLPANYKHVYYLIIVTVIWDYHVVYTFLGMWTLIRLINCYILIEFQFVNFGYVTS